MLFDHDVDKRSHKYKNMFFNSQEVNVPDNGIAL